MYNPNLCEPVDISCYFLGSSATQGGIFFSTIEGQGIQLPANTIVPPGGFCVIRGSNAPTVPPGLLVANGGKTVVVTVPPNITDDGVCVSGTASTRLWFPNAGGWFAFYDNNDIIQDAISWGDENGIGTAPCVPAHSSCGTTVTALDNYTSIPANRKEKIYSSAVPVTGNSIRRLPDGGVWQIDGSATPTLGDCNGTCASTASSTCDGEATVNVTGGSGNYTYVWDDSQGQLTQTAIELCAGTYTVIVTDQTTSAIDTFTVVIEDVVPTVSFNVTDSLCNYGQSVSMGSISSYSPNPIAPQTGTFTGTGINGNNFDVSQSEAGTFEIIYEYTDENGCVNSDTSDLTVLPIPQAQISNINLEYCLSDSVVDLTLSPAGGTLTGSGTSNENFVVNDAGVGTHIIQYAVESAYGCKDTAETTVVVNENPDFTTNVTNASCEQDDGEIIINPTSGTSPYLYSIDGGNNTQGNGAFTGLPPGNYNIVVTDDNGCSSAIDRVVSQGGFDSALFIFNDFCEGDPNGPSNIASPNGTFSFVTSPSDGATIDSITGVISNGVGGTTYNVRYIITGVCADTSSTTVTVHNIPTVTFEADTIQGVPPLHITFTNNSTNGNTYSWNFGDGSTQQNNNPNVTHTYQSEGTFTAQLIGENNNGLCADTATIEISVIYPEIDYEFPNIFTPNGDGSNDFYNVVNHKNIKSLHIIIVNRWGNLVFESDKIDFQWNGKVKNSGGECIDGTYFYKAEIESYSGEEFQEHGFIHLNRK